MLSVRHYAGSSSNISMGGFYPERTRSVNFNRGNAEAGKTEDVLRQV
jgi:hypothetical protein